MDNDHNRRVDVVEPAVLALSGSTLPTPTQRHRALEEIVEITYNVFGNVDEGGVARIRELARLLHRLEPMDEKRWTIDADPARANETRAHAALASLAAFPLGGGFDLTIPDDLEALIGDLVCGLMHLADRSGVDPLRAVDRGEGHYREEAADATEAEHTESHTTEKRSTP